MSIVDPPRTFTRNGVQISAVVVAEAKAVPVWQENDHPRDREGKFIETGAEVRVWGGALATVVRNVGGGRIEIQRADGTHAIVHRNYLTVTKRPDGSAPTSKRVPDVAALPPAAAPEKPDAVHLTEPTAPPNVDTGDIGEGLDHFLRGKDTSLADQVASASHDYQDAVGNGIPGDEADERAKLINALDEVDQKYGDDRRIRAMSTALRAEAQREPDGKPNDVSKPTPAVPDKPAAPAVPATPPKMDKPAGREINDGDVLHPRMGRVTVVGQPQRQPNGSYELHLDRGDGKPPVSMMMGSRDRANREVPAAAAPEVVAAQQAVDAPVTVRAAGTPDPGFPIPAPPAADVAKPAPDAPAEPDLTAPDTPKAPATAPERRQINGFSAAESAMIHNAVEDHAAQYYGGPMGMTANDAARYTSEGHLKDLVETHGLSKVWQAAAGVITDDESVLTRSQEDRDKNKADRDARLKTLDQSAGQAAQGEQWDEALAGLAEIEAIDPTYRPAGLAIDDLRKRITTMRGTEAPPAADAPGNAPDAPATPDVPAVPAGDKTGNEYAAEAYLANQAGDRQAALTAILNAERVEPAHAERWRRLRREYRGLPAVPTGTQLDQQGDVVRADASATNVPDVVPAKPATQRRFATLDAVRQWFRGDGSIPLASRSDQDRHDRAKETNDRISYDPGLTMSTNGGLIVHRNPQVKGRKEWRIASAANGMHLGPYGTAGTREEALDLANRIEAHVDADGNPVGWDQDDIGDRIKGWKDADGTPLLTLLEEDRQSVPTTKVRPSDWKDHWYRGEAVQPVGVPDRQPDPAASAPEPHVPDAAPESTQDTAPPDIVRQTFRVINIGTDVTHATYQNDTGTNAPDGITLWRAEFPEEPPTWMAFEGDVYLGRGASRQGALDEADTTARAARPRNGPAATAPDAEPSADVDEPAVPPVDSPGADAPAPPADGRWKIAPVETSGDPEADKQALAASLRAAARAADNPSDRAALNWAARQLVPPKPRAPRVGAPAARTTTRSPKGQARAQADADVTVARRASKPPVSAEARMQALADLADELDRLGLGGITITPPTEGGGEGGDSGGGGGSSIVAALRGYVAEYKKRRSEVDAGATPGDSESNGGGTDGSDSGAGGGALQEVPAGDVQGAGRPGGVLPESGDGGGPADRRLGGPASGSGPADGGLPGPGSAPGDSAPVGGGVGDAGDGAAGPGDGGNGTGAAGDGLPAVDGSVGPIGGADAGGSPVGDGVDSLPGRERGTGGNVGEPAAVAEPVRPADAGLAADGVTEADQPTPEPAAVPTRIGNGQDFKPQGADDFAPAGKVGKLNANIAALHTLRALQEEKRPATSEEQAILAKWAGWGGLPEVFDPHRADYAPQREELQGLLSEAEWNEAKRNTLNAHYTDARVVEAVWQAVGALGFDGGRVLEPGSGSGTFIGFAPENAHMVGVELDSTTAALSQYLYPNATIRNESFARTNLPDGSFDATIGNVPFGNFQLTDRRHNASNESIHNHFILKSMDLTRPGGLVAVLTSRYTLDSLDSSARQKMADKGDLVGAVRLPTGSHQRVSGTDVIEDLLIFRVRAPGEAPQADQSWITSTKKPIDNQTIAINDYWESHPENVLGTLNAEKGQYGTGDLIVRGDRNMSDLPDVLAGIVDQARSDGLVATVSNGPRADLVDADESRHDGHLRVEPDGTFTQAVSGASVPFDVPAVQRPELASLVGLRDTLSRLLDAEASSRGLTPEITNLRAQLNSEYDAYVAKNGPINRFKLSKTGTRIRPRQGGFRADPMSAIVRALETYDPSDGTAEKASIFTKRAVAPRELRTSTDDPADAVSLSIDAYGEVNVPAIANMLGTDEVTAREQLAGHVFEEPPTRDGPADDMGITGDILGMAGMTEAAPSFTVPAVNADEIGTPGKLEPSAAYLSGNVRRKLAVARAAAALDPRFQANVDALKAVIPADLGADEINARLGAAWIDKDTVEQFLKELIQDNHGQVQVSHSGGAIWSVAGPNWGNLSTEVWGTEKRSASQLVQALLEQRSIKVTRKNPDGKGSTPDLEATLAAQEKAVEIQDRFGEWLWEDPDRARKMQARYNDQFNALVLRSYDGTRRTFPGMAETWKPHDHVKSAVERMVNEPTVLLAHVVGAGKTAEMVMGSAEMKRLGMARKPAIVVPNHMLEQFTREYLEIYPQAKLLAAGSEDLRGDGRREFVGRAATGDWDAVILTQGAFESVPMSQEQQQAYIDREMATMRAQLAQAQAAEVLARANGEYAGSKNQQKTVKKMETALLSAEEALKKKMDKQKDVGVSFEQTGIDYLMIDEAHGYSNLRTLSNIQGAGTVGSDKATDLHMKMEYLRETSQSGRVATFATGTPIRNTVTQAYVMQKFLRPDLLEEAGITSFDQWASTFGKTVDAMELKPEGTGFRQTTRFAKFQNVPEFLRMFHTFADVKMAEDLNLPTPDLVGGKATIVVVPSTDALAEYIADLGDRADMVRSGGIEPEDDNMLKISGDGRKAALSMKLVGGEHEPGKIEAAADRIASIWQENKGNVYTDPKTGEVDAITGGMQIVFLDMGTPGSEDKWNGYDKLKSELTDRGMDPSTIRYIHEAKNDAQKAEMFAAARAGRISVLIGSSEKMGVGTNMQRRAVALHHLDAPWRPADLEQRDGRIMRQGNLNKEVQILRYVTEGSFDTFMWQTLERKAKFIHQIMRGSLDVREIDDIGDTAMSHGEVKALSAGNPDLLDKAKADNELQLLTRAERTFNRTQTNLKSDIVSQTRNAEVMESYAVLYDRALGQRVNTRGEAFTMAVDGRKFNKRTDAADAFRDRLSRVYTQDRWGGSPERDLGTIGGFTVTGQVETTMAGNREIIVRFSGVPGEVTRVKADDLHLSGIGLVTRLESSLEAFEAKRDRLIDSAAEARIEVARMEGRVGAAFPKAAELEAVRVRSQRINMKIERDARRSNGEDIPFDPLIDSGQYDTPLPDKENVVPGDDFGVVTGADLRREAEARAAASDTTYTDRSDQELADMLRSGPTADQAGRVMEELTRRAEQHAAASIASATLAEPGITKMLQDVADARGGSLEGLENRLKKQESLSRKVRDKSLLKGRSQADIAAGMNDVLRYTMVLDPGQYAAGAQGVLDGFVARGFTIVDADNTWAPGNVYQGINAVLRAPNGALFELQFHTPESFAAKHTTHVDYELARDPSKTLAERQAAHDRMAAVQAQVKVPPNVAGVGTPQSYPRPTKALRLEVSYAKRVYDANSLRGGS